jgi:hypothetical protein
VVGVGEVERMESPRIVYLRIYLSINDRCAAYPYGMYIIAASSINLSSIAQNPDLVKGGENFTFFLPTASIIHPLCLYHP